MVVANFISPKGAWQARPADSIVLDAHQRHGRRIDLQATNGLAFTMDLPLDIMLRGGDALVLEDGRLIEIIAAPEELAEIRFADVRDLARLAWRLGNLHAALQIFPNRIRVRCNEEIETLARSMGAKIAHIEAPFDPEGGAYAGPDVAEAPAQGAHVHGPGCGHDHHEHDHHGHDHHSHEHGGHGHDAHEGHDHKEHAHEHDHAHHDHDHHGHDENHKHG